MSEKSVPEVRFRGFAGEWEKLKLSDVADIVGGGTPSTQIPDYWNGEIEWYSPTEIGESAYADHSQKTITELGFEKCSAKMLPANTTVLFTSRAGIGDMAILRHVATTNQGFQSFVMKNGNNTYFLYSSGCYIKSYALKNASGSTFLEISGKQLGKMDYTLPDEKEQTKIGEFFKNLDNLIAQNQKKYDKLLNMKKACLDKMFPKNGADTPEVRFNGFLGQWEQSDLSQVADYKNGKSHENKQCENGKYELINLNSISIDGGLKCSNKYIDDADETLIMNDLVMILSDVGHGDLLGRVALIPESNKYVLNQRVALLRPKQTIKPQFLFSYINSCQRYFKLQGAGMSQLNISKGTVEIFSLYKPNAAEQTRIGTFFQTLDTLITLQKTKLEKLKNIKKACLDKMFI